MREVSRHYMAVGQEETIRVIDGGVWVKAEEVGKRGDLLSSFSVREKEVSRRSETKAM